jgi:uncharacterized Tic20 family protein
MNSNPLPSENEPTSIPPARPATNWRLYMELLSFAAFIFPFGNILGPLVLWLLNKEKIEAIDLEGKRVLNFNLSWTLWGLVTCGLGFVVWFIIAIIATIKAANHEAFQHPLSIRFLK